VSVGNPERRAIDGLDLCPAARQDIAQHRCASPGMLQEVVKEPDALIFLKRDTFGDSETARLADNLVHQRARAALSEEIIDPKPR